MGMIGRLVRTGAHAAGPFVRSANGPRVAGRGAVARSHARIAFGALGDPDSYSEKATRVLGRRMEFFNWEALHHLYDEVVLGGCYAFDADVEHPWIIDAGANVGLSTLWFALAYPTARITAIEADTHAVELLRRNVERNGLGQVDVVHGRIGASDRHDDVPTLSLLELVDGHIDMLKLDLDGTQIDAVLDLARDGGLDHVRTLTIEYHDSPDERLTALFDVMRDREFDCHIGPTTEHRALEPAARHDDAVEDDAEADRAA